MSGAGRGARAGASRSPSIHHNLVLVQVPEPAMLDALLARSNLRDRCVLRLSPERVLLPRAALPMLRRRLAELELATVETAGLGGESP